MKKKIIAVTAIVILTLSIAAFWYQTNLTSKPVPQLSDKLQNCVWLLPSSEGLQLMSDSSLWKSTAVRLEGANINGVIVWAGNWNADHTINYADSPNTWTQFIQTVKAVNPNFKVLALVGTGGGIDISNPEYRTEMISAAKQLLSSAPFDGWNDDLESYSGSNQDLINYWQGVAGMVKDMGGIATVDTGVDWSYQIQDVYPSLTNFDYIMPMFYATIAQPNAADLWNNILSNSPVPVIMGLAVNPAENGNTTMAQQLNWIDSQSKENLTGYSIWAYDYLSNNDFNTWSNWVTNSSS